MIVQKAKCHICIDLLQHTCTNCGWLNNIHHIHTAYIHTYVGIRTYVYT